MNPYKSPQKADAMPLPSSVRLDVGVLVIATIILAGWILSIASVRHPWLKNVLMPRFGWVGLMIGVNIVIFIGCWIKTRSSQTLAAASFMSCSIASINGLMLLRSGTVEVVENVFHDRLHSAWGWSVGTYLAAGIYLAIVARRHKIATCEPE